jgi:hypothetical protein
MVCRKRPTCQSNLSAVTYSSPPNQVEYPNDMDSKDVKSWNYHLDR